MKIWGNGRASGLLALAWAWALVPTVGAEPALAPVRFVDRAQELGLDFRQSSGASGGLHLPEIMAGGAALFDADGDGDLDAYLVDAAPLGPDGLPSGPGAPNRLFLQGENGRFVDATRGSGLGDRGYGMGVAVGDHDGDGDLDVLVTNWGLDRLYRNEGGGRFQDVTEAAGLRVDGWSTSAAFLDYDRDGRLDLWIARYVEPDPKVRCRDFRGAVDYCQPGAYEPVADVLLRGLGDGRFEDVSERAGLAAAPQPGLGVACADFDGDGWVDVLVANDGAPNQLWMNQRDGTFRDEGLLQGAALNAQGVAEASMGVLVADLDGDLDLDAFLTHLRAETNTLLERVGGRAGFRDSTGARGLGGDSQPWTGFGAAALDVDHDGDLDLAVVNGAVTRGPERADSGLPEPWSSFAEPNLFFLNDGEGRFRRVEAGDFTRHVEISRALAAGDVDGDGDVDLLVGAVEGPARLYLNETPSRGRWLSVDLRDPRGAPAIGALVNVRAGATEHLALSGGSGSYLSAGDPRVHFGLGGAGSVDRIDVAWPDGARESFGPSKADRRLVLRRGEGTAAKPRPEPAMAASGASTATPLADAAGPPVPAAPLPPAGVPETPPPSPGGELEARVREAIESSRAALVASPSLAIWESHARLLHAHDLLEAAIPCYRAARALAPEDPRWPYLEALATERLGRQPEAVLPLLRRAAELAPDQPLVHFRIGEAQLVRGDAQAAEAAQRRAIALDPQLLAARRSLGQTLLLLDRPAEALAQLEPVLDSPSADRMAAEAALRALGRLGRDEEAAELAALLDRLVEANEPADPWLSLVGRLGVSAQHCWQRGQLLLRLGRFQEAIDQFDVVREVRPQDAQARFETARALLGLQRLDAAEGFLQRTTELDPSHVPAWLGLADLQSATGRHEAAAATIRQALAALPGNPALQGQQGVVLARAGDLAGAETALRRSIELEPAMAASHLQLGLVLEALGRLEEAAASRERALALDPGLAARAPAR